MANFSRLPRFWDNDDFDNSATDQTETTLSSDLTIGKHGESIRFRISSLGPLSESGSQVKYLRGTAFSSNGKLPFVCFNNEAVNFSKTYQINDCICVRNFHVQANNFSNEKDIVIDNNSKISFDETANHPEIEKNFEKLRTIATKPEDYSFKTLITLNNTVVQLLICIGNSTSLKCNFSTDGIGILSGLTDLVEGTNQDGKQYQVRTLQLTDECNCEVDIKIWSNWAKFEGYELYTPIAFINAKVSHYQGHVELSLPNDGTFWINPKLKEADDIKAWFQEEVIKTSPKRFESE